MDYKKPHIFWMLATYQALYLGSDFTHKLKLSIEFIVIISLRRQYISRLRTLLPHPDCLGLNLGLSFTSCVVFEWVNEHLCGTFLFLVSFLWQLSFSVLSIPLPIAPPIPLILLQQTLLLWPWPSSYLAFQSSLLYSSLFSLPSLVKVLTWTFSHSNRGFLFRWPPQGIFGQTRKRCLSHLGISS